MRRAAASWLIVLPFAGASVLVGHKLAYTALGMPADNLHGYLDHAPQLVAILATVALLGLAADSRARRRSPVPLASLAVTAFVVQEHVERLVHTGQVPFLLTSPTLWLGIVLQLPLAVTIWLLARRAATDLASVRVRRPPRPATRSLGVVPVPASLIGTVQGLALRGRGPPACL